MNCNTCKQPLRRGDKWETFGDGAHHEHAKDCVKATARRCMAIAKEVGDDSETGAYRAYLQIDKEFVKGKV